MEDQQLLITKLQGLKSVSPRKEWVILTKTKMFAVAPAIPAQKASFMGFFAKKQFAYSLATLALVVAGAYGVLNLSSVNVVKNSTALLAAETDLKNNVELFKVKSQNLSDVSKSPISDVTIAVKAVKEAAKSIAESIKKDPELASKVALEINNNKTYLDVAGGNGSSEVSDMYETIVTAMIKDLDDSTLTKDQETELVRIKASLKSGGDYTTALRDILLISRAREKK